MDKRTEKILNEFNNNALGLDDTFKFNCTRCGKCCKNREDILLNPRDVYRVCNELSIKPDEFIKNYCQVYIGETSKMVVVRLLPYGPYKICPLLKGNKCSVHNAKPTVCATFPIGRGFKIENYSEKEVPFFEPSKLQYFYTNPNCGDNRKTHTVRDWLKEFDIPINDEFFAEWQNLIMYIRAARIVIEKTNDQKLIDMVFELVLFYTYTNFALDKDFMEQFRVNTDKLKKRLDEVLIKFVSKEGGKSK